MKKILALTFILMTVSSCCSFDSRKSYLIENTKEYVNDPIKHREWLLEDSLLHDRYFYEDGSLRYSFEEMGLERENDVTYDFILEEYYCEDRNEKHYDESVRIIFKNSQNKYYVIQFSHRRKDGIWKHIMSKIYDLETEKFYLDI